MKKLFVENDLELFLDNLKISKRRFIIERIKMATVLPLMIFALVIMLDNPRLLLITPLFAFMGWKMPYFNLVNEKNRNDIIKKNIFPQFLRYFVSLYPTNETVLRTLGAIVPFIDEKNFRDELIKLIESVGVRDVDSSQAYLDFAEFIGTGEARLVMSFLYEFDQMGIKKEELTMLENIVNEMHENSVKELCEYKANKIQRYANPIVIASLFFVFCFVMVVFYSYLTSSLTEL